MCSFRVATLVLTEDKAGSVGAVDADCDAKSPDVLRFLREGEDGTRSSVASLASEVAAAGENKSSSSPREKGAIVDHR